MTILAIDLGAMWDSFWTAISPGWAIVQKLLTMGAVLFLVLALIDFVKTIKGRSPGGVSLTGQPATTDTNAWKQKILFAVVLGVVAVAANSIIGAGADILSWGINSAATFFDNF